MFVAGIGAWAMIEESGRVKPVDSMYVWDACSEAKISFTSVGTANSMLCLYISIPTEYPSHKRLFML